LFGVISRWAPETRSADGSHIVMLAAPESSDHLPDRLDGIDVASGLLRLGGNRSLYRRLLGKFADNQRDVVRQIESATKVGDITAAIRLAHTLKGVAANIGAQALADAAAGFETEIKRSDQTLAGVRRSLAVLAPLLETVLSSIDALNVSRGEAAATVDADALRPALATLRTLLEEDDADASHALEQVMALLPADRRDEGEAIRKAVAAYDFEAAKRYLSVLTDAFESSANEVPDKKSALSPTLRDSLLKLDAILADDDTEATEFLDRLGADMIAAGEAEVLAAIRRAIGNYNFPEARKLVAGVLVSALPGTMPLATDEESL
jgi:HPt (histidine-containing phosphotransfer) domain-containing protein